MKKVFLLLIMIISASLTSAAVYAESITELFSERSAGVFEEAEDVEFTAVFDNASQGRIIAEIRNINGNVIKVESFDTGAEDKRVNLNFGKFSAGWYSFYLYDGKGNTIYDRYAAFVVTKPFSKRFEGDTPFALDGGVAEYTSDIKRIEKYANAYRLMGIKTVRERTYYGQDYSGADTSLDRACQAYAKHGIDILSVWSKANRDYSDLDLREVYSWQKDAASRFSQNVTSWEIVNEADIINSMPTDYYASILKAGAIGAYDGNPDCKKSFGSVCSVSGDYPEVLLQNDVMKYIDTFNVHSHREGSSVFSYRSFPDTLSKKSRILSTVYGGKPVWVTEAGLRMQYGSDGIITSGGMKTQAAYAVTSAMESIEASGVGQHFYFLGRHYVENNREYGIFSENDMPYPAVSTLSELSYYLGKGEYLGKLRELTGGAHGYVFDTGSANAVVLYNTKDEYTNVQIDTSESALVVDLLGGAAVKKPNPVHNKINVRVGLNPIIVVLNDELPSVRYYASGYSHTDEIEQISDSERIVIQTVFDGADIKESKYILEQGGKYNVSVKVYNLSSSHVGGMLRYDSTEQISPSISASRFSVQPNGCAEYKITLSVSDSATPLSDGYFMVSGYTSARENITKSVSSFKISKSNIESFISEYKKISDFNNAAKWTRNSSTSSFTKHASSDGITFSCNFGSSETLGWCYPYFYVNASGAAAAKDDGTGFDASGYDGIYFEAKTSTSDKTSFNIYINDVLSSAGEVCIDKTKCYIPFGDLPDKTVNKIAIGFTKACSGSISYTISDVGFYKMSTQTAGSPKIKINTQDKAVYNSGTVPKKITADIGDGLDDISVYVNNEYWSEFSLSEDGVTVDLKNIGAGDKCIIVSGMDKFGRAVWDMKNIYISKSGEYSISKNVY